MTDTTVDTPAPVADVPSTPVETPAQDTPTTVPTDTPSSDTPAAIDSAIDVLDGMNPEELTAIIEEAMRPRPTEPVSFPADNAKKDETPLETTPAPDALWSEIDRLNEEVKGKIGLEAELETMRWELESEKQNSQLIEDTWSALVTALPDLQSVLESFVKKWEDGKISYDETAIPTHFNAENRKRVVEHPVVWPLVLSLEKWEEINVPEFVKALTAARQKSLPRTADAEKSVTTAPEASINNPASLLMKGKRTISFT